MAYKGKNVVCASGSHLISELKDFLVSDCGWSTEGPSTSPGDHDDPNGLILGWFLTSNGEDTNQDIHMHLGVSRYHGQKEFAKFDYVADAGGITDSDTDITVYNVEGGTIFTDGCYIRIDDEIILVGTVSGTTLSGCQRGWGVTDPASHSQNDVIQLLYTPSALDHNVVPIIEMFAFSDLTTALVTSNAAATGWTRTAADFTGDANIDGQWERDDRFNWHALIEAQGTPNKMRWIYDFTNSGGAFTMQPYLTAPGAVVGKVYSGGFLPGWSKRGATGTYGGPLLGDIMGWVQSGTPPAWDGTFMIEAGFPVWFYGSKDGVLVIVKYNSIYYTFYFGNPIPASSPLTTTLSSGVSAGATTVDVSNVDLFTPGQKARIIAQSVADWNTNEDQSASTYGGASANDWDDLDPEEIPTEEVVVLSVGASSIDITAPLIFTYSSGAVIGEDPRPAVRSTNFGDSGASLANRGGIDATATAVFCACYLPSWKEEITQHASHRQVYRAFHRTTGSWNPGCESNSAPYYAYFTAYQATHARLDPADTKLLQVDELNKQINSQNDELLLRRVNIERFYSSGWTTYATYGVFQALKGFIPFLWEANANDPPLGGSSEDTVQAMWSGAHETFRMFHVGASTDLWIICGPEIA